MEDLFEREDKILTHALSYLDSIPEGTLCSRDEYIALTREYAALLKLLRRFVKVSDGTADDLKNIRADMVDRITRDPMTGAYNRRYMEERLEQIIRELKKTESWLSVLLVEVDCFKQYNDFYGYGRADECLCRIAEAVREGILRETDFVARYGGAKFAVVLPGTDREGAILVARRILENVKRCAITHEKNTAAPCVTVSVGASAGNTRSGQPGKMYLKAADEALYCAKRKGMNRYMFLTCKEAM